MTKSHAFKIRLGGALGLGIMVLGVGTGACGAPGGAGDAVRPKDPTAADALGEDGTPGTAGCTRVSPDARPFLADWKTDARAELEAVMQRGVAVVHYDCDGIRVLHDCEVKGEYVFASIPAATEERVIEENSDLSGTIPLSAASISAEMSRGLKLKLKYALVGRKGAPKPEVLKSELRGNCDGATHFVRAALVGAFELGTATEGAVGGSAKVLGAGAEGHSRSAREMNRKAGNLSACRSGEGQGPPRDCEHLVQLQLGSVVEKARVSSAEDAPPEGEEGNSRADAATSPCSAGYVLTDKGECKKKSGAGAYLCKPSSLSECVEQCAKGSAQSCHNAGFGQYAKGVHPDFQAARDAAKSYYEKGCSGGYKPSCSALAPLVAHGKDRDVARARSLYEQACAGGEAGACMSLAFAAESPMLATDPSKFVKEPAAAFRYTDKACTLGSQSACAALAKRYIEGNGVLANTERGLALLQKQCDAGNGYTCYEWGGYLLEGRSGVRKDPKKALELFESACEKKNTSNACVGAGLLHRSGATGVKKDAAKAKKYLEHACQNLRAGKACAELGRMLEHGEGGEKNAARALQLYEIGCPPDKPWSGEGCYEAAVLYESGATGVAKRPALAATTYARACTSFDQKKTGLPEKACRKAASLLIKEKKETEARRVYSTLCFSYRDKAACDRAKKLSPKPPPPPPPGPPKSASK